ncbi:MAG: hypothetical protein K6G88_04160 [Lachnospiraceae bacterium]|nr:hypothetical protein [Lachnospiraceae bacterium]
MKNERKEIMRNVSWGKKTLAVIMAVVTMASTCDVVSYRSLLAAETEGTVANEIVENEDSTLAPSTVEEETTVNMRKLKIVPKQTEFEYNLKEINFEFDVYNWKGEKVKVSYYVEFYTDSKCTHKTTEADGAKDKGKEPSKPGTYYPKVVTIATTQYDGCREPIEIHIVFTKPMVWLPEDVQTYTGEQIAFDKYDFRNPDLVEGLTVTYNKVLESNEETETTTEPTTDAPIDAGTYNVTISAVVEGETVEKEVSLVINKAKLNVDAREQKEIFTGKPIAYTNYEVTGVNGEKISEDNIKISYSSDGCDLDPKYRNVGSYVVYVIVSGLKNYEDENVRALLTINPYSPVIIVNGEYKPYYNGKQRVFNNYTVKGVEGEPLKIENMNIEYYLDEACTIPAVGDDPHTAPSEFRSRCYVKLQYKGKAGENYCDSKVEIGKMVIKYEPKIVMPDAVVNYTGVKQPYPWDESMIIRGDDKENGLRLSVAYYKEYKNMNDNVPTGPADGAKNPMGAPSKPGEYIIKVQYHESINYNPKAFYGKLIIKSDEN